MVMLIHLPVCSSSQAIDNVCGKKNCLLLMNFKRRIISCMSHVSYDAWCIHAQANSVLKLTVDQALY